ncbi:hypothetical protein BH10BAC6_BH10BAC6_13320 [soil metagenome]
MKQQHKQRLLAAGIVLVCILAAMIAKADVHPAGGALQQTWQPGATMHITWTQDDVRTTAQVLLWSADAGDFTELASGINAATGSYDWVIPSTLQMGDHYRIAIRDEGEMPSTTFAQGFISIGSAFAKSSSTSPVLTSTVPSIAIGPNPTSNRVHVCWSDERTTVVIRRLTGEEVQRTTIDAQDRACDIDVHTFSAGVYSIELVSTLGDRLRTILVVQ